MVRSTCIPVTKQSLVSKSFLESTTWDFYYKKSARRNLPLMKTKTQTKTKTTTTKKKKKSLLHIRRSKKTNKIDTEIIIYQQSKKQHDAMKYYIQDKEETLEKDQEVMDMRSSSSSVAEVEKILNYRFRNKTLLEDALTHSSYTTSGSSPSNYQRLEFVGDAALGLAIANFVFITYPNLEPGQLSLLRAANISTEKLARVAIRHGFYQYLRRNAPSLDAKVKDFALMVQEEGGNGVVHGGAVKAPKVLADIVESIAAAIYVDCEFDLKLLWKYFGGLLEPLVILETLQHQPVTMLYELCQKEGKQVDIRHWRKGSQNIASVYVNGQLVGSGCSEQKDNAKINAAKEALKLWNLDSSLSMDVDVGSATVNDVPEIDGAKQKLMELCSKNTWQKPTYKVEKEVGPSHDKRFICSVQIETVAGSYLTSGGVKPKLKDAENSAASMMFHGLQDSEHVLVKSP